MRPQPRRRQLDLRTNPVHACSLRHFPEPSRSICELCPTPSPVPLIISIPGTGAGRTSSIVELVDLFPTLSALAGLSAPVDVQGKSLVPILDHQSATVKESAISFVKTGISMRSKDWAYIRYRDGGEELYNMAKDPKQFTNLAQVPRHKTVLQEQRAAFEARLVAAGIKEKLSK